MSGRLIEAHGHPIGKVHVGGRKRPVARCPRLSLANYVRRGAAALPTPPAAGTDYSGLARPILDDVMLNNSLGDCVIAGGYHVVGVETANAGDPFHASEAQIIADYGAIGGYNPNVPGTDNGCDEQTALNYWTQHGFANGTKLVGWMAVNAADKNELELACYLFENLYFGVELPDAWLSPFPSGNGFTWDVAGDPDPNNGHCFMGFGYNPSGIWIDTWGMLGTATWAALAKYATAGAGGEAYVLVSPDQLAKGQAKAPNGLLWSDLLADFQAMGGIVPPPEVGPMISLADAQALLAAGWPKPQGEGRNALTAQAVEPRTIELSPGETVRFVVRGGK